jgi:hypothetical protein
MTLATLAKLDRRTAEGVLAAAALATSPDSGIARYENPLGQYSHQAADLLTEIRNHLRIKRDDNSPGSKYRIDAFLARALQESLVEPSANAAALHRVGQLGRLAPALYRVVQTNHFSTLFNGLGVSANHVEDAVKRPDDYQHLMSEFLIGTPDEKTISLFMKKVISRDQRNSHWLLVQTHRTGTDQVAQAAWKIYPDLVDLSKAATPLDVLRAFVDVFGCPLKIGDKDTLFVAAETFPYDTEVIISWHQAPPDHFYSVSVAKDADKKSFVLGTTYCVDLSKYRSALRARGIRVTEPDPKILPIKNELHVFVNQERMSLHRPPA